MPEPGGKARNCPSARFSAIFGRLAVQAGSFVRVVPIAINSFRDGRLNLKPQRVVENKPMLLKNIRRFSVYRRSDSLCENLCNLRIYLKTTLASAAGL